MYIKNVNINLMPSFIFKINNSGGIKLIQFEFTFCHLESVLLVILGGIMMVAGGIDQVHFSYTPSFFIKISTLSVMSGGTYYFGLLNLTLNLYFYPTGTRSARTFGSRSTWPPRDKIRKRAFKVEHYPTWSNRPPVLGRDCRTSSSGPLPGRSKWSGRSVVADTAKFGSGSGEGRTSRSK